MTDLENLYQKAHQFPENRTEANTDALCSGACFAVKALCWVPARSDSTELLLNNASKS
jgi:hypothetical protein